MAQSILIVDDEKEIVSMLYCYFSKLGYTVYTATAGNAALKEVEKKPDIILLDVNMPDIDGFTVCERIRDYVSCPIIFLTARIEDSDKIKLALQHIFAEKKDTIYLQRCNLMKIWL